MSVAAYCRTGSALQGDPLAEVQQQAKAIQRYAKGRGEAICDTYMYARDRRIDLCLSRQANKSTRKEFVAKKK
jgi:hypothetical protein